MTDTGQRTEAAEESRASRAVRSGAAAKAAGQAAGRAAGNGARATRQAGGWVRRRVTRRRVLVTCAYVAAWLAFAAPIALVLFFTSSATTTVASHDSVVRPTTDHYVTLHTGPFLPDVRAPIDGPVGVDITLGKTETTSAEGLVERYAFIASQPDAQVERVERLVTRMAYDAAMRGAVLGAVPILVWLAIGRRRRRELVGKLDPRHPTGVLLGVGLAVVLAAVLVSQPWESRDPMLADTTDWQSLPDYVPEITVPAEAQQVQVSVNSTTYETKRLVLSAVDTFRRSKEFYATAALATENLDLRQPAEGETVALMVSDRHDNIGMDPVARAIADKAGATAILNAGDDTSTGQAWEAFSLDSLDKAFRDYDQRFSVLGNHDHGSFVEAYLEDLGWTVATGEVVEGPGGGHLLAFNDPRSSGLGNWRDEPGLSIDELASKIADVACASDVRVNTLLVHDADMATEALRRGCVDIALSGHVHVQVGPDPVRGLDARRGYAYTNGTTGGAAYALAVGSKLRRPAEVTLVTYRHGRPVGLQPVTLQTNGVFEVGDWLPLHLD